MTSLAGLVDDLGPLMIDPNPLGPGASGAGTDVVDLCLHAAGTPIAAGDLVLAVDVRDHQDLRTLVTEAITAGASGVISVVAADRTVVDLARRGRLALATKAVTTSWTDLFRALQVALDTAVGGVRDEHGSAVLHQHADRLASLWRGPVTIEDLDGVLLAHSRNQDDVDEARRTTIVDRRTSPERLEQYRTRGLDSALADGDQVWVPAEPGRRSRTILPIRVGDQPVGSVWLVTDQPLGPDDLARGRPLLHGLAHHLSDPAPVSGGALGTARTLRSVLHRATTESRIPLGSPPWVVGVITAPGRNPEVHLGLWYDRFRRRGWREPLLTVLDDAVVCVLHDDGTEPGSLSWWRTQVEGVSSDPTTRVAVGRRAMSAAELHDSWTAAKELTTMCQLWPELTEVVLDTEQHWSRLVLARLLRHRPEDEQWQVGPLAEVLALPEGLRETLMQYLATGASIPRTASALTIHPNTLRYRLGRIARTGVDLEDPLVRMALHLQLLTMDSSSS
ncbi:MAG TPA: helix-turn-helix domain-containing protein [Candidatus Avipropionibacterium avicola]|uniref:Helix-turn-helix domain-containing protein n=1 Tax=Candidatus Avipropionibacterium avicola TaxID=2840701 RepID=A0A9D1GXT4_9ACTN|nr:helix-turn-helix domain-containing protein [Candidatus Avipropionibacterium avicola]